MIFYCNIYIKIQNHTHWECGSFVGRWVFMTTQIMLQSMLWDGNSAQYSCDFETLGEVWALHKGRKINWQSPADATNMNIINSCFCMFNSPIQSLTFWKNNIFHLKTHEKMSCSKTAGQSQCRCLTKGYFCETVFYSCCESAEQYEGEGGCLTFSLCWHLEGYSWATVVAGGVVGGLAD